MPVTLFERICREHKIDTSLESLAIYPDQGLMHDATATPACLQLEAAGIRRLVPKTYVYCDHNLLQVGFRNADDHRYLRDMARKLGMVFSAPGTGICHQTHLEEAAFPGGILLGADSHTPMAGGLGMLAIGAGGIEVATALAGEAFYTARPLVVGVRLEGQLPAWVTGKDVVLELLRRVSVRGGVGRIFEYHGPGVAELSVPERATICNMGAETGATTSLFPSDERTRQYLKRFGRESAWRPLAADPGAVYDDEIVIHLDELVPLIALPDSPDNVRPVAEVAGLPLNQVCIGSCTNASFRDLAVVSAIWQGRRIASGVDVSVTPGTRRTLAALLETGRVSALVEAGARLLDCACGACNGVGQSPCSGGASLRTFNRNFKGRTGTADARAYLASPETAAASALTGVITDPRSLNTPPRIVVPGCFPAVGGTLEASAPEPETVCVRGPNIRPIPPGTPLPDAFAFPIKLIAGDNVTTDHLLPGGAEMLSLRSNIPASVPHVFERLDPDFAAHVSELPPQWIVVGGANFGQGSSREHAVIVPMSIGMKVVLAVSLARIFRQNLINNGVIPLTFVNPADVERLALNDVLEAKHLRQGLREGRVTLCTPHGTIDTVCRLTPREAEILEAGGIVAWLKARRAN